MQDMPHHANRGMTTVGPVFSLIDDDDDDDDDTPDIKTVSTPCPPYPSSGGYQASTSRSTLRPFEIHVKQENDGGIIGQSRGSSLGAVTATVSAGLSLKQREASEYSYAQALLKQEPNLSESRDLDRSSVIRLAKAYVTLRHGLQSWESTGNQTKWWPPNIDDGKLALAAQETLNCFVLIITSKGNVVYVSDVVEALLGHDQLSLVGRSVETLVPNEELRVLADQFSILHGPAGRASLQRSFYTRMINLKRSGPHHQKFELVHAVGHLQEVVLAPNPTGSTGQRETWLMCACRVMAPHIEKEGSDVPCVEWVSHNALDGKYIYVDARSCQVSGFLPDEMVGLSPYCFVHPEDQEHVAFSHNQALINVGGSTCTYRMYTHSQNLVYVHSTMQLARDKLTNRPKFLFCLHRLVDEQEGRDQVSRHQQELMWVKSDPSVKYSMTDIERTVRALEVEGVNSPAVLSRGGMKCSVLSDSCAADGGDLLKVNLSSHMRMPPLIPKLEPGLGGTSSLGQQQGIRGSTLLSPNGDQYHAQMSLPVQVSSSQADFGPNFVYDNSTGRTVQQQQQHLYNRQLSQHHHQQQQQQLYSNMYPAYQQQQMISLPSSSRNDSPVSATSTGSFVDYLFDTSGPPSVPSDGQAMYGSDMHMNQSIISPTGRGGRGRSRTRGRPRGSGRGGRGSTRGVRGTRGSRARGGRGRGRGNTVTQSHETLGGGGTGRKSESLMSQGSLSPISIHGSMSPRSSLSPIAGSGDHMFMSPDPGMQRSSSGTNLIHQLSEGQRQQQQQPGSMSELQHMRSSDMFQRMTSLDGMDMLDPTADFSLHDTSSLDLMSPRSWGTPEVAHFRSMSGSDHMPGKRVGRPRGSKNQQERQHRFHRTQSIDDPSLSVFAPGQQSALYGRDSPFQGPSSSSYPGEGPHSSYPGESPRGMSGSSLPSQGQQTNINNMPGQDSFQRSLSFQGQAGGRLPSDTDPEHSILGNLLKGRSGSTSSAGGKSPAHHSMLLTPSGRTSANPYRSGKSPMAQSTVCSNNSRGGRSPAHSIISDGVSPISAFSPDSSRATPSIIKNEPEMMSPLDESGCGPPSMFGGSSPASHNGQDIFSFVLDQESKSVPDVQVFSAQQQLRQKHQTLEQGLVSQDSILQHLETSRNQTSKDQVSSNKSSFMEANKSKQQKELRAVQAKLEVQIHQQRPAQQQQPQQQQLQQRSAQQQQQQQQQQLSLQRHRLNSPAPAASTRRMAIVPPIQRQPMEADLTSSLQQHSPGELKPGQSCGGMQQSSPDVPVKQPVLAAAGVLDSATKVGSCLSFQQQTSRQLTQETVDGSFSAVTSSQTPAQHQQQQQQPPQQSPFSLHHHHHHHHHYHHHPISAQPHLNFQSSMKDTPPPAYGSYDSSMYSSSSSSAASNAAPPTALTIAVSSSSATLTSPVICDTSPVSVDESPSCASDASSGYHSLSHGADTMCVGPPHYSKPHCLDVPPTSSAQTFSSKTPSGTGKSPDMIPSSTHISSNSPAV